ncbi:hypothetical protein [Enterococcus sp. AZ072]|uniref:hypothetical protein n=1 Tax=unclassified Enterococcus TaxID=2608891 RepID=UPI003D2CA052
MTTTLEKLTQFFTVQQKEQQEKAALKQLEQKDIKASPSIYVAKYLQNGSAYFNQYEVQQQIEQTKAEAQLLQVQLTDKKYDSHYTMQHYQNAETLEHSCNQALDMLKAARQSSNSPVQFTELVAPTENKQDSMQIDAGGAE